MLSSAILVIFLTSTFSVMANPTNARIENTKGAVFLVTPRLKVRISAGRPDIMFWASNETARHRTMPVYHVGFHYIAELFGDDMVVDSRNEIGGKIYNLYSDQVEWKLQTANYTNELRATLTSSQLSNGATISFVYHIYLEEITVTKELNNSKVAYVAHGLKEIKFDIIVNNWSFSDNATGLIFLVNVHELAFRHRLRVGNRINSPEEHYRVNGTNTNPNNRTADPHRDGIIFVDTRDNPKAYFSWSPIADIYDLNGNYIKNVNCTPTIVSYGYNMKTFRGRRFGVEYANLILAYPNYGDGLRLEHDPTIGVEPENLSIDYSWTALIALPLVTFVAVIIKRKRH